MSKTQLENYINPRLHKKLKSASETIDSIKEGKSITEEQFANILSVAIETDSVIRQAAEKAGITIEQAEKFIEAYATL